MIDNFDLRKYLTEGTLLKERKSVKEEEAIPTQKSLEEWYEELVPGQGAADTVEGEIIRAIAKINYRYLNDGDYYNEGYGIETAGPAHSYLTTGNHELASHLKSIFSKHERSLGPNFKRGYEDLLDRVRKEIEIYINSRNGKFKPNTEDMLDYPALFTEEPEDADYSDYDYDDDEDYEY